MKSLLLGLLLFAACCANSVNAQNNTRPTVPLPNGFEVNSYTGNLYHRRTDMRVPGRGLSMDITFSFNASRRNKDWGLGRGWTFTYNMAYHTDTAGFWVERADGRRDLFRKSGANYVSPKGIFDVLKEYQTGKFYLQSKEGTRYYFDIPAHKKLTRIQDANGNQLNLAYADTLLRQLSNDAGHILRFSWKDGRLSEIADNSCEPVRKVTYEYDSLGNPKKVINPLGDSVLYYSDAESRIVGYTDEGGNSMSIFFNSSGAVSKAVSCATSHSFNYAARQLKTFVAEQVNGQNVVTTYQFDSQGRVTSKKGNCCGFNLDYTYDAGNNVIDLADGNKKHTAYEYDSNGNVTKETDPAGQVATYTYNQEFNKVTSFTDKNGNTTTFQYDGKGNVTQINKPLDFVEKSTYDSYGNRLTYVNANNNTTKYEYDNSGNLTKITDPEGGVTSYTYDCYGNKLTETDPGNNTTKYSYDALNQLVRVEDALGNITSYAYNKLRLQSAMTNALGKTTTYVYDGLGRRISTLYPMGNSTQTEYDGQGNVISETDGNGNTTSYTYNNRKQPLSVTDPLGNSIFYEYDEAGNKLSETDKNGNTTRFEYNDLYQLTKVTNPLGGSTYYNYDAMGNRITELDANANVTTFTYDALQRLVKVTDAQGYPEEYTFDKAGNQLTVKDKNGNVTTTAYDKLNRSVTVTNPLSGVTTYVYDARGSILSETDPLNRTTLYTYDGLKRVLSVTNPMNEATKYTYDAIGNTKTITSPNGRIETRLYDDNSRLVSGTDQLGPIVGYTYDANDNVATQKDGNNNVTAYQYDAANQLVKTTFANSTTIQIAYDAYGNKTSETDQVGKQTVFLYDKLNRPITLTDPLGNANRFAYDILGNLVNIIDAKGNTTSYTYDTRNQLILQTYADGSTRRFTYDAGGRLNEKLTVAGRRIRYKYDALNRLTEREYPGSLNEVLQYDAAGQLSKAINKNATITFTYDAAGRLLKEDNSGKATAYKYDVSGKTKSIDYPGGTKIEWQLDERERLTQIRRNSSQLAALEYDAGGRLIKKVYANQTETAYSYDNMDNLVSLAATPAAAHLNLRYRYNAADMRTITERVHKPSRSEQYTYDDNFQLKNFAQGQYSNNEVTPTISYQYNYDALGNRTFSKEGAVEKNYISNFLNQYTSVNSNGANAPPSYDKDGNLLKDGKNTYEYDFENRLLTVDNSTTRVTYTYDALGRRLSRTQDETTTTYYYDRENLIEESTGNAVRSYVYGAEIDQILFASAGNSLYFYQTDDLNNVQTITDGSGNLLEYYSYDPFGIPHIYNAAGTELTTSSINNLLFTGRPYEFQFQIYHYRNREMNPNLGRFAQRDPLEYIDGLNSYAYLGNDPINFTDPLGLMKLDFPSINPCELLDLFQLVLDFAGLVPGFGEPADLLNAEIYRRRGDYLNAVLSAAAAVPIAGWGAAGTKLGVKASGASSEFVKIYRVYGGEAQALGRSWTPINPNTVSDYRKVAGLPDVNTGQFVIEGYVRKSDITSKRDALPLHGNPGGLPEYVIGNPKNIIIDRVSGVNREF